MYNFDILPFSISVILSFCIKRNDVCFWGCMQLLMLTWLTRVGMTNPPFILEHLEEISKILNHSCVFSYLHVPVQSGSNSILDKMKREYTVEGMRSFKPNQENNRKTACLSCVR